MESNFQMIPLKVLFLIFLIFSFIFKKIYAFLISNAPLCRIGKTKLKLSGKRGIVERNKVEIGTRWVQLKHKRDTFDLMVLDINLGLIRCTYDFSDKAIFNFHGYDSELKYYRCFLSQSARKYTWGL